jgi:hypothetical protein
MHASGDGFITFKQARCQELRCIVFPNEAQWSPDNLI